MNWSAWPYWVKSLMTVGSYRLTKIDIVIISLLGLVLSALTFFSNTGYFFHLERGNQLLGATGAIFSLPYLIGLYPLILLSKNSHDPYGAALGSAIFATYLSPLIMFVLCSCAFLVFTKVSVRFLRSRYFVARHGMSLVLFALISSPYAYYMVGTNAINACLSGKLTPQEYSSIYPDHCFEIFSERTLGTDIRDVDSKTAVDFCKKLSDDKPVARTGDFSQLSGLSYQDYCLYTFKPLPTERLCEVVSSTNTAERKQCLGYFAWENRPRGDSGIIATKADFSSVQISGKVIYSKEQAEITLVKREGEKESTWIVGTVSVSDGLTHIEFDADLLNASKSEALLTIYVAEKNIASVDGRLFPDGKHRFQFEFPAYGPGEYMLGFRLDIFAQGTAQIKISNISTGFRDYPGMFDVPHNLVR